ncbi:ATP synthase subunit I [Staphylococcus pettenkoferi]|uniref:ATP synthase subunit I n=1 Tax=Staphylococcus pettenkoferi TaxID=170573 RepID=UPI002275E2F3|nr:ATP synthase subunit I [Staphylococcus pettenkoferi]MCY1593135.1 ATP synthase subunit I [Staphylococcus pettenkoferi]MCY1606914.1 ATP synthase subunit I [Staphylococcus pettenkoferi]MCY1611490.1 ATP synthase subunit I [Staphylococcus pettenkoferi]MCY1624870.1 ATP synthase subunit I [Staphylococcus pettenkoferi]MDH9616735.1 ATP synthase subunit I [Staphylococcus pettenkoferi]
MKRFYVIFQHFIQYYLYAIIVLGIVLFFTNSPFILGLILGTTGSLVNTFIFEYYLARSSSADSIHISTGSIWRYLTVFIVCVIWFMFKEHINIFGVVIGLIISYLLMIFRPFYLTK